ncbi:hypothetical protein DPMN_026228 [Dreissena polymorpha]|uniref:Uncharacterized protein n=1 Tax=Dreissena polymorpha TaxID=45954 RepID=A0A9D4RDA1_DREPO|nr:hypothetical protein DPMN_026228 [Dreissena polymorpha]
MNCKLAPLSSQDIIRTNVLTKINYPPRGSNDVQLTRTIFELIQDIIKTNFLTEFHEDLTIILTFSVHIMKFPPPVGHVFQPTDIIGKTLLTDDGQKAITKAQHEHIVLTTNYVGANAACVKKA